MPQTESLNSFCNFLLAFLFRVLPGKTGVFFEKSNCRNLSFSGEFVEANVSTATEVKRIETVSVLEKTGIAVSRYGLAIILLLIGLAKFTPEEAAGIQPLVAHSPLMSWMYAVLSVRGVSNLIGCVELVIAVLLVLRPVSARLSFAGSVGAIVTFVLTGSFLFSTPGAFQLSGGISILGAAGQFLIKDLALLGAAVWTAAEALKGSERACDARS